MLKFKSWVLSGAVLFLMSSCKLFEVRKPASDAANKAVDPLFNVKSLDGDTNGAFENLFRKKLESQDDAIFSDFIKKQISIQLLSEDLVKKFDEELDVVHKKMFPKGAAAAAKTLPSSELVKFEELRLSAAQIWQYSENNIHEMMDFYKLAIAEANDPTSPLKDSAKKMVNRLPDWIEQAWQSGSHGAVLDIASHIELENERFKQLKLVQDLQSLDKYIKLGEEYLQNKKNLKPSFDSLKLPDESVVEDWNLFRSNNEIDFNKLDWFSTDRKPQNTDTLYPDAGNNGNVTGRTFPSGLWALTFDDGPHPTHTPVLLSLLQNSGVHATFFWLTSNVIKYPKIVSEAGRLGLSRGIHSYTHANLPKLGQVGLTKEINLAHADFFKAVGQYPTLFRCPYGACGKNGSTIRKMIAEKNMLHIFWTVDTLDWQDKNPNSIFERTRKQIDIYGRGVILFHDIHSQSVIATKAVINYIKSKPNQKIVPLNKAIEVTRGAAYESP